MSGWALLADALRIGLGLALHLGLCAALLVAGAGLPGRLSAWLAGQRGSQTLLAPFQGWSALWRKSPARAEPGGGLVVASLCVSLVAAIAAILLTPGFVRLWPAAVAPDLLTLMGLLIVSRLAALVPAFGAGIAADALPAQAGLASGLRDLVLAAVLAFAIAQAAGGSQPGSLPGLARLGGPAPATLPLALACAIAAAVLLAASELAAPSADRQLSGPDLACARLARAIRVSGWVVLVALLLPPAPLPVQTWSSLAGWPVAIAIWLVKLAVALLALMLAAAPGRSDARSGLRRQGACLLFCVLSALLVFISGRIA